MEIETFKTDPYSILLPDQRDLMDKNNPKFKTTVKNIIWFVLFITPFILYFYYGYQYALNVPVYDDYVSMLKPVNSFLTSTTFREQLVHLFSQYTIHRNIFTKFLVLIQYYLTGNLNFRHLILISNFAYGILVIILVYKLKVMGGTIFQLLPIPYILLSFTHYVNMIFFSAGGTFYWNELFSLLLIIVLTDQETIRSSLIYPLTIFTTSAGLAFYPLANIYNFTQSSRKRFWIFFINSTIATAIYFYKFRLPASNAFALNIRQFAIYYFTLLGNATLSLQSSLVTGGIITCLLLLISIKTFDKKPFLALLSLWILLVGMLIAISRNNMGIAQALSSRYAIYSLLAIVCIYIWGITTANETYPDSARNATFIAIIFSVLFFFGTLWNIDSQKSFAERNERAFGGLSLAVANPKSPDGASLLEANQLGIYDFKVKGLNARPLAESLAHVPQPNSLFLGNIEINKNNGLYLRGWALISNLDSANSNTYIALKKDSTIIRIQAINFERSDVSAYFNKTDLYDYAGYEAYPGAYNIPSGIYSLGIMVENGKYISIQWEDIEVDIP